MPWQQHDQLRALEILYLIFDAIIHIAIGFPRLLNKAEQHTDRDQHVAYSDATLIGILIFCYYIIGQN